MKPPLIFLALGLLPIAACATQAVPVELQGLEQFSAPCPSQPPTLSEAEIAELVAQYPNAADRERFFWAPRDLAHRACEQHERARADGLLSLGAEFNQIVRDSD
jgi:hypothetical protein